MTVRALPLVKICGLTRPGDAEHARVMGANYLGVVRAGGPRLVSAAQGFHVFGRRLQAHRAARVAVFGDQPEHEVLSDAETMDLDVLQMHSPRSESALERLARESGRIVWPVVRVAGVTLPDNAAALAAVSSVLVLDAHVVGHLGGTGVALDWSGLVDGVARLREQVPDVAIVLAGGLRPSNVDSAIRLLSPQVVDVSSGVETVPGVKDPALVQQFVQVARGAMETQQ